VSSGPVTLGMEITDIDVPDNGSMAVVITVMNKGTWSGRGTIVDGLDKIASGIVGALAGGQLAEETYPATKDPNGNMTSPPSQKPISPWWAGLISLGILAVVEGIDLIWTDCDGWVVNGTMMFGRADLDQMASQATWSWTAPYPGSDSPVGCGSNSDYSVTYQIIASSLPGVVVPDLFGQSPTAAINELTKLGLSGEVAREEKGLVDTPEVTAQDPAAGTNVLPSTTVSLTVTIARGGPPP